MVNFKPPTLYYCREWGRNGYHQLSEASVSWLQLLLRAYAVEVSQRNCGASSSTILSTRIFPLSGDGDTLRRLEQDRVSLVSHQVLNHSLFLLILQRPILPRLSNINGNLKIPPPFSPCDLASIRPPYLSVVSVPSGPQL